MAHGLNVSLGTDGNCTNNNQDMFDVMKFSALLHKFNKLNPTVLPAETVFRMATLNGATACAWNNEIGTIKQGKRADLALVNIRQPHFFPVDTTTLVPNLVYSAHGHDVESCIVNGKLLMENRVITMLDEMKILEKAQDEAEEFLTSRRHVFTALPHRKA
jgi:5-methylthioadenosine/S-adenosylhomocysteine deaminase